MALFLGCGEVETPLDAGGPEPLDGRADAASSDGSVEDASRPLDAAADGGRFDAGAFDGGAFDGGAFDGGAFDGGNPWTGTPCSVDGVPGVCQPVGTCAGVATPGFCPGPAEIQCCTPSDFDAGAPMDAGAFTCDPDARPQPNAALLVEAPGVGGCPAGMIPVADFCVDRYEASLALVGAGGALTPWSPYFNPGDARVRALSVAAAVPQGYITGRQAAAACAEAGKRLCTDAEWLRACRGASERVFPYGDARDPGVCNDARAMHPAVEYFGTSADWIWSMLGHPCINQLPASLAPTGDHPGCVSEDGAYDMVGNLHEWTADPDGTFRGGFYADTERNGPGCLYRTTAHSTGHWDYSTGFRCCADR
ncbi:MAG TPA: SUMF1/EgtB/PvdO family nonheme iron enzyme [Polyangiaceae bacterium LLY-WYZ-15_(1-7)]|nr:SUMF1/EgtB/PvdO family nonheme iron enzyme [Polyangiaceae bacterium LLY-WYZ-15_(1-7)]HJL08683.1 SUMF1/EgtB/PvdO family nonheme iron enzyme [Polyangiaceae bacterium LLY-WYZ-15_(1-7)]